jgi:hypothetical protein
MLESEGNGSAGLFDKPQGASGRQEKAQGVGADHPLVRAALVLPKASEGSAIANRNFHGPPVPILGEDRLQTPREIGGKKRFQGRAEFASPGGAGP